MPRILTTICLFLLAACTGTTPTEDIEPLRSATGPVARSAISAGGMEVQFENLLARKLFHLAVQDIQSANPENRFPTISAHYHQLGRALNPSKLSMGNQQQLRLFNYLWEVERQKGKIVDQNDSRGYLSPVEYYRTYLPQGGSLSLDTDSLREEAGSGLLKLHKRIQELTRSSEQIPMFSIFESARDNSENYLPNTEYGRQEYLTRIVDNLLIMQEILPSYLNFDNDNEFVIEGFEDVVDDSVGTIFYDAENSTLRVGLHNMNQLPLHEIESAAHFYGVPGLHSIYSARYLYEVQSLISLPGFEKGWAAYAAANLNVLPAYQHPQSELGRSYFEAGLISLAIIDLAIHTEGWSPEQAIKFALQNSPLPEGRLRTYIDQIQQKPGLFAAPLVVSLEIENMKTSSENALTQKFDIVEFHKVIMRAGPLPLTELKFVVSRWTRLQLLSTSNDKSHQ